MRKRSKYRPKPVITNPLTLLMPATKEERGRVMLNFLTALEAMARGSDPSPTEWQSLSDVVNTLETMADMGKLVHAEVMPTVNACIEAMAGAADRYTAGKGMRLDAAGLQSLRDAIDIYGQCMDGLTAREMSVAQAATQHRVNNLLRAHSRGEGRVIAL